MAGIESFNWSGVGWFVAGYVISGFLSELRWRNNITRLNKSLVQYFDSSQDLHLHMINCMDSQIKMIRRLLLGSDVDIEAVKEPGVVIRADFKVEKPYE